MKRQPIKSSSILTAGYEWDGAKESGTLEIEFTSTAVYRYLAVPLEAWRAFLATDSKGGYFVARIRDRFKFECVYRPPRKEKTNGTKDKEAIPATSRSEARTKEKKARIS